MVEVKNVCYSYVGKYQTYEVLRGISCEFNKGHMNVIMGPSGSGKSTLLHLLAGLDLPVEGEIYVNGKSILSIDRDRYRREDVSVIYQSYNLFQHLTSLENVAFPMRLRGYDKRKAEKHATDYISLVIKNNEILHKRPPMMSGGEQQRIAIARALASGGNVILADEPTGNLDAANSIAIATLLKELAHDRGYTVVLVTHSNDIAKLADAVFFISDGRIYSE